MTNKQKGMAPILIALLVAIVIGGGIYFYSQNKKDDTRTVSVSEMYVNEEYGFQFKKAGDVKEGGVAQKSQQLEGLYGRDTIFVYTKPKEALRVWVKNSFENYKILGFVFKPHVYNITDTKINGYNAVEVTYDHYADFGKDIFIEHPTENIIVEFRYGGLNKDFAFSPQHTAIFESFKFIPISSQLQAKTYSNEQYGFFSVIYSPNIFHLRPSFQSIPPRFDSIVSTKLISAKRNALMGKEGCMYGESGLKSICDDEKEEGISFAVDPRPLDSAIRGLDASLKSNTIIGGKNAVVYKYGAEGDGADHYYIPLNEGNTLIITRMYRHNGFLTEKVFNDVLSTLDFVK
jgi:hypothetical protein